MLDDIVRYSRKLERSVANFVTIALEDRISALTTKDPNKLAVYQQGLDGHAYRAAYYYSDQMPEITEALKKAETATKFWIDKNGEYHCE